MAKAYLNELRKKFPVLTGPDLDNLRAMHRIFRTQVNGSLSTLSEKAQGYFRQILKQINDAHMEILLTLPSVVQWDKEMKEMHPVLTIRHAVLLSMLPTLSVEKTPWVEGYRQNLSGPVVDQFWFQKTHKLLKEKKTSLDVQEGILTEVDKLWLSGDRDAVRRIGDRIMELLPQP